MHSGWRTTDVVLLPVVALEALSPLFLAHLGEVGLGFYAVEEGERVVQLAHLGRLLDLPEVGLMGGPVLCVLGDFGLVALWVSGMERRAVLTSDGLASIWRTERVWSAVDSTMTMRRLDELCAVARCLKFCC